MILASLCTVCTLLAIITPQKIFGPSAKGAVSRYRCTYLRVFFSLTVYSFDLLTVERIFSLIYVYGTLGEWLLESTTIRPCTPPNRLKKQETRRY